MNCSTLFTFFFIDFFQNYGRHITNLAPSCLQYLSFYPTFLKKGKWDFWDDTLSVHLSVCSALITFEPVGRISWNTEEKLCHWSLHLRHIFHPVALNIQNDSVRTSEVDSKLETINVRPWNFVCWQNFKGWPIFIKYFFVKNQKYEGGGWLNLKTSILLNVGCSLTVALVRQMKFGTRSREYL
jgi:hypothetical protein